MDKSPENQHCPVCGFYCLGKGGAACIDKPALVARAALAEPVADEPVAQRVPLTDDADSRGHTFGLEYPALTQAAALLRSQAAELEALRALCIDYSIACGELSKGLSEDDPMWSQLKSLGERIDAAIDAARQS